MPVTHIRVRRIQVVAILALALCFNAASAGKAQAQIKVRSSRPDLITSGAEKSVQKGLAYLARTQHREGHWGTQSFPTAMTSLAGLALLAGGNTPYEGRYAVNVRRATDHLLRVARQNSNGLIAEPRERSHCMHGHGFAMLFLGEVYGMGVDETRQRQIRRTLRKAIELTAKSQSDAGGWLYSPNKGSDEGSVTVSQVQGLRACYNAGIDVPKSIIKKAGEYLNYCSNPDGGICYSARSRGSSRPAITAAAVATMYHAGEYDNPVAIKALKYLDNKFKGDNYVAASRTGHRFYTTFYMSQAMYLSSEARWKRYFPGVRDDLVRTQTSDGSWSGPYGKVYATSICLTALQLPYANLPIFQR